jgi:hypothetical protein
LECINLRARLVARSAQLSAGSSALGAATILSYIIISRDRLAIPLRSRILRISVAGIGSQRIFQEINMKKIILFLVTLASLLSLGGCFFPDHGGMDRDHHEEHHDDGHHDDHHDNGYGR